MKKYWIYNLIITSSLLIVFLTVLYTCGIYDNDFGRYSAVIIVVLLVIQLTINLICNLAYSSKHTRSTTFLGLSSMLLSLLIIVYTWSCTFLQC